jgi:aspartokinase
LNAEEVQLYTDVPGVCSADPMLFPGTVTHTHLSFDQAARAAHHGLKLLYSTTIEPAQQAGIPVRILDAANPEASSTIIGVHGVEFAPIVIISERDDSADYVGSAPEGHVCISVVLAQPSKVLSAVGDLAGRFKDGDSWHVMADPLEQVVELHVPAETARQLAQQLHSILIGTQHED